MQPETFARYAGASVPRYTSYPTAPAFSAGVGSADYRAWLAALPAGAEMSVYVHIPFCRAMCLYCGCHTTVSARQEPIDRYLKALETEIDLVAAATPTPCRLRHLHFGGGSPTLVRPEQMLELMARLRGSFDFSPDAEIAIEIDPRTLTAAMAQALGEAGFNRASLGVQSFDPVVQRAVKRVQSFDRTAAAAAMLRGANVGRLNIDLIYGLPHQTVESCLDTAAKAVELAPDRFAVFGYAHVPDFKLHQRKLDPATLPGAPERLQQARAIAGALKAAGYLEIGLDHFARSDDTLAAAWRSGALRRNFQGYTTDQADVLIGLGSSAIGKLPQGYVQNTVLISDYLKRLGEGILPVARGYAVSREDQVRGAIIERIMCDRRVELAEVCARFGWEPSSVVDRASLGQLESDGLIRRRGTVIEVKEPAYPLVRSVAAAFDSYLGQTRARHSRAV